MPINRTGQINPALIAAIVLVLAGLAAAAWYFMREEPIPGDIKVLVDGKVHSPAVESRRPEAANGAQLGFEGCFEYGEDEISGFIIHGGRLLSMAQEQDGTKESVGQQQSAMTDLYCGERGDCCRDTGAKHFNSKM